MFRKRKAPLFESALSLGLPELGNDFAEDRAAAFEEMTGKPMDVTELTKVFDAVFRVPMYLIQIILYTVVSLTSDPWEGFRQWRHELGETGLREQWKPDHKIPEGRLLLSSRPYKYD